MADPTHRLVSNAAGPFYVDENCINCDLCREHAPAIFSLDDSIGMSRVYQQPESAADIARAQEAIDLCPIEAIGHDPSAPGALQV
jgi:ferredoxin